MEVYQIAVAAFLGAVLVGFVGWLKTTEPFNPRKFGATVATAIFVGATVGVAYVGDAIAPKDLVMAFLAGAGADYGRNVVSGAIAARVKPTP